MVDEGITTYANLTPKKSLKPKGGLKIRRSDLPPEQTTDSVEMWTGQYMEGVSDLDKHLPDEQRKKYAVPRMTKVPFESHINNGGDLQTYFEKGWCLKKDMPPEAKKFLEIANNRTMISDKREDLTPEKILARNVKEAVDVKKDTKDKDTK